MNSKSIITKETINEVYTDLAKPATREIGSLIARIPKVINAALSGVDKWILQRDYNLEETKKLLSQKLQDTPEEKIIAPENYIAIPALEAISYSMDNESLREMYSNLLAKSMNVDTKDFVHPSYVEIIKQLSPFDARLLADIKAYGASDIPIIALKLVKKNSAESLNIRNNILSPLFNITIQNLNASCISISNLTRLNLINITYLTCFSNETIYDPLDTSEVISTLKSNFTKDNYKHEITHGLLQITDLGLSFLDICI